MNNEIELADGKLRMLFRLTLLYDIEVEITDSSLDMIIKRLNQWYESNNLV
jgi:hypothetical protein